MNISVGGWRDLSAPSLDSPTLATQGAVPKTRYSLFLLPGLINSGLNLLGSIVRFFTNEMSHFPTMIMGNSEKFKMVHKFLPICLDKFDDLG